MRVLVCGGRDLNSPAKVHGALDTLDASHGPIGCIITGGATGADHWAETWAWTKKRKVLKFPADHIRHGHAAGPIRNQQMIDEGRPDIVMAFPGRQGKRDMVIKARELAIKVIEIAPP